MVFDNENVERIHSQIDEMEQEEQDILDNVQPMTEPPEQTNTVMTKFRVKAELPSWLTKYFDSYRCFFGTHVAYSNTKRLDNPRHIFAIDLCQTYEKLTYLSQHATDVKIREVSEFQMGRGNEEIGGFEAKLGMMNIIRQDANIKRTPMVVNTKPKRFLGIFPSRKKTEVIQ